MSRFVLLIVALMATSGYGGAEAVTSKRSMFVVAASATPPASPFNFSYAVVYSTPAADKMRFTVTLTTDVACDVITEYRIATPDITVQPMRVLSTIDAQYGYLWNWTVKSPFDGVYATTHTEYVELAAGALTNVAGLLSQSSIEFQYRFRARYGSAGAYTLSEWFRPSAYTAAGVNDLTPPAVSGTPTLSCMNFQLGANNTLFFVDTLDLVDPGSHHKIGRDFILTDEAGNRLPGSSSSGLNVAICGPGNGLVSVFAGGTPKTEAELLAAGVDVVVVNIILSDSWGNTSIAEIGRIDVQDCE